MDFLHNWKKKHIFATWELDSSELDSSELKEKRTWISMAGEEK